jgi:hypothetical protein
MNIDLDMTARIVLLISVVACLFAYLNFRAATEESPPSHVAEQVPLTTEEAAEDGITRWKDRILYDQNGLMFHGDDQLMEPKP